ncbi:MAG TPA: hypothetical protein VGQ83_20230 [Polyangia bacterium]|jgi:DNA-binding beta-propeller fold protein YncE
MKIAAAPLVLIAVVLGCGAPRPAAGPADGGARDAAAPDAAAPFDAPAPAADAADGATVTRLEYVFPDGWLYAYDLGAVAAASPGQRLDPVKKVALPTAAGVRGVAVDVAGAKLYLSYGGDGTASCDHGRGSLLQVDLRTDAVTWTRTYDHGVDGLAVTPDGTRLYVPSGECAGDGVWYVASPTDGADHGTIDTCAFVSPAACAHGPHNTIVSLDGAHVYLGNRDIDGAGNDRLFVADTATNAVTRAVGPFKSGLRPFTINGAETLVYMTVSCLIGFQVGDLATGQVVATVDLTAMGFTNPGCSQPHLTAPSHGISLSPDERELFVIDAPNDTVHVFDVSGARARAPVKVADLRLSGSMSGDECVDHPGVACACAYDCQRFGWLQHSIDGRYLFVGDSGDVIDTVKRQTVAAFPAMADSRKMVEIDFQSGRPLASSQRSTVGHVTR